MASLPPLAAPRAPQDPWREVEAVRECKARQRMEDGGMRVLVEGSGLSMEVEVAQDLENYSTRLLEISQSVHFYEGDLKTNSLCRLLTDQHIQVSIIDVGMDV